MSARDVVSSNKWRSSWWYVAAANTRVAAFLSHVSSSWESGLGRIIFFVCLINFNFPAVVVGSAGSGGGVVNGEMSFPGTTTWIAGMVVAHSNIVSC